MTPTSLTLSDVTAVKIKKAKDDKKETTTNETDEKIKELTKTDEKDKTNEKDKTDEKDKDDETSKDKTDEKKKKQEEKDYVFQAKVNVSVTGTLNQITKTIDEFNKMKGVEISKFNFSESTDPTKPATVSLEIVIYMAEQ
ncbi:hypothetical protein EDD60_104111 [Longibaculum muris]|uniref:Uncharacterized protein n=1 Tax=Longibaculum muris TaxID=1796628 RepID=A0A4R3Z6R1_9FIRM|nr:hypothetical protein HMPREF3037_02478 [Candidatus Stoquefichus sp. KLE1796]TCW01292.1 hypothetical protein EDD60_104111 [Longibaculum muris]